MPHPTVVLAIGANRIPQNVFQWVKWRAKISRSVHRLVIIPVHLGEPGTVFVVVFAGVAGDMLAPDDALAVSPVAGKGETGHAVALRRDQLILGQKT